MINENGEKIGKIKDVQENNQKVIEAHQGKEVAISIPGIMFDRLLGNLEYLYSDLNENQFKKFKDNKELLTSEEIKTIQKIAEIKRREKVTWGI